MPLATMPPPALSTTSRPPFSSQVRSVRRSSLTLSSLASKALQTLYMSEEEENEEEITGYMA